MISQDEIFEYVTKPYPYQQRNISIIDNEGRQIVLDDFSHFIRFADASFTVKIESMEKYSPLFWEASKNIARDHNHHGPVTCHLFWAKSSNAYSFPEHIDLDDVVIYCLEGTKHMMVEGNEIVLKPTEELYIPKNTKHRALNREPSIILSFGLERFSVEKI